MTTTYSTKAALAVAVVLLMFVSLGRDSMAQGAAPAAAPAVAPIQWTNVKAALEAPLGTKLYLKVSLVSVASPRPESKQPWSLYVADATGTIRTVVFQDIWSRIPDTSILEPGSRLDLFATVGEYRGERQLEIAQPNHFRRTPGTVVAGGSAARSERDPGMTFSTVSIGSLNITHIGQPVRVRGTVMKYSESENERMPYRVVVKDDTGEVEGTYWKSVAEKVAPENRPVVGQQIELSGVAAEFNSKMQVRVDDPQFISRTFSVNARGATGVELNDRAEATTP